MVRAERWVPPDWKGRTVAVLASGPSMSSAIAERVRAAAIPTIVVNSTVQLAPWADVLLAGDRGWWTQCSVLADSFNGLKVTSTASIRYPGLLYLVPTGPEGYDHEPNCVRTGGNSGYQAVHVAMRAGARRIVMCGVDLTLAHGVHWHGPHPRLLGNPTPTTIELMRRRFATLVVPAKKIGVEIVNCSPISALQCFDRMSLDEALKS